MTSEKGVIYVAFGRPYLAMAAVSAESIKKVSPHVEVAVVTNVAPEPTDKSSIPFDHWFYEDDEDANNRRYKIAVDQYTPFEKTVFMDCDTAAIRDISDLFDYLNYFDVAMQLTGLLVGYGKAHVEILDGKRVGTLSHWNSGVIAFRRNQRVTDFFEKWRESFYRLGFSSDQVACVEAVYSSEIRHLSFDWRWNSPMKTFLSHRKTDAYEKYRIVHYTQNSIAPDVEKYMRAFDKIFIEHLGLEPDTSVADFIAKKHRNRKASGMKLLTENLLESKLSV